MGTDSSSQDQRKRPSDDALKKRCAVAVAELEVDKKKYNKNTSSAAALPVAAISSSLKNSSQRDKEENDPTYLQLSHPVHEKLQSTNVKFQIRKGRTMADTILHKLLQNGDVSQKYMQGSRGKKLEYCILLDNFVQGRGRSTSSKLKATQTNAKRSKKHMSLKNHKKCGSFDVPQHVRKYDNFLPMHEMWKAYIGELLKNTGSNPMAPWLLNADLHGALILVVESKVASFTGVSGIMIRETAETFGIITQDDNFWVVPKKLSIFTFQVECSNLQKEKKKKKS